MSVRQRDLFPRQWSEGFDFLKARESWVLSPKSPADLDDYLALLGDIHAWAVECIKTGSMIELDHAKAWQIMAYMEIELFMVVATVATSEDALRRLVRGLPGEKVGAWHQIAADRMSILDMFASMSSVLSRENVARLRSILVP